MHVRNDEEIVERVNAYYRRVYGPLTPRWRKLADDVLDPERERERIENLERDLSRNLRGLRVLEIGSGFGLFLVAARQAGAQAWGIEPEDDVCATARRVLAAGGVSGGAVCRSEGEQLPFGAGTFDLVCAFQVLEHTRDPAAVMAEALRVTRSGGLLYFVVPNSNSFWESHYGMLWLPRMNKRLAKWLVRLRGRDPRFLDTVQATTPGRLRSILAQIEIRFDVLSWGLETWRRRLAERDVTRWGQTAVLRRLVRLAAGLGLTRLVAWLGERLEFYYPIILVLRRK